MIFFSRTKKITAITGFCFSVGLFLLFFISLNQEKNIKKLLENRTHLGVPGSPQVVIFEDFQCEECQNFHLHILPLIESDFIKTGLAEIIFIPLQLIGRSDRAIAMSYCLAQHDPSLFIPYLTSYFLNPQANEKAQAESALTQIGIDLNSSLLSCKKQFNPDDFTQENLQIAKQMMTERIEVPTIFIEGQPLEDFSYHTLAASIQKYIK